MRNILFILKDVVDGKCGGIERVTEIFTEEFEARGNAVFYLCVGKMSDREAGRRISPKQYFLPDSEKLNTKNNLEFFEKFLRERKITHIVWQEIVRHAEKLAKIADRAGAKSVQCLHMLPDDWRYNLPEKCGFFKRWRSEWRAAKRFRKAYALVDKFVVLSPNYFPKMKKYLGKSEKLCAIANPMTFSPQNVDFSEKKKEILYLGRLDNQQKRVDRLLQIWAKIERDFPDWTLKIVGDGCDRAELETLAGTLNLRERLEFCGYQEPQRFYRTASIFCMTSAHEAFPMVLLEAASFACVPVAFDSFDAVHDIIVDGENGAIVPAFDCEKYAEILAKLLRERDLRERLAANALRDVAKFSREKIVERWEQLLDELEEIR